MPKDRQDLLQQNAALQQALSELAAIHDAVPVGLAVIGTDFRFQRINARLAGMNGLPVEAHLGRTIREVVPNFADVGESLVRRIVETGEPILDIELEGETPARPGAIRNFLEHWSPLRDAEGCITGVIVVAEEVTAQRQAAAALRANEARLAIALRAGQLGVFEYAFRPAPAYFWDRTVRQIWGVSETETITDEHYWSSLHPDDLAAIRAPFERMFTDREPSRIDVEYRIRRFSDQAWRWVGVALDVLFDDEGPVRMIGTVQDITDRKLAEEQARLLMREVNHRAKNLLAVVQSIALQTARSSDPATFADRFSERLAALAASQDLLVRSQWNGVDVEALVTSQLAHFKHLLGSRIHVSGPAIRISANAAQNLGMALHELATNAAKYGALSGTEGEVSIAWSLPDAGPFTLSWRETKGPAVTPPAHRGLGSHIITRLLGHALSAEVKLDFAPAGLSWTLTAPSSTIIEPGTAAPAA